ncbi:MAG: NUDIX hydrolase [Prochloron sp. SP5CPC1]|nr:NUDIX hydrolase [Candidatus Paraprochloron terpiosi SP5CPC1]
MGRLRHLFITWLGVIFRYPVVGATIIAILPDGKIVLVKRPKKSDQKEEWGLPGGMVDWGEDIPATVSRELKEETGLNLVKIKRIVGVYSEAFRDPRVHSIAVSVEVEAEGTFQVEDTLEIEEARAFTVQELRPRLNNMVLIHDHRRQLQDYFQGLTTIA